MRTRFNLVGVLVLIGAASCGVWADSPAHVGQPVLMSEHGAMMDLVRAGDATHVAVKSGRWSEAGTWAGGTTPGAGAVVRVPKDVAVIYDVEQPVDLKGVRVEGALAFDAGRATRMAVETLLIVPGGRLTIGTAAEPIRRDWPARVTFTDGGPIDSGRDPLLMGRGLISHGEASIVGEAVTPFVRLAKGARRGETVLVLASGPENWRVGDRLVLPATSFGGRDEELAVMAVNGREVTVRALAQDHIAPAEDLTVPVANLSRAVAFESRAERADRAGHAMFMHAPSVALAYASFERVGRTDKSKRVTDPKVDEAGKLIAETGVNARGRYAVHFHRTGVGPDAAAVQVVGCVVTDSPGWGFVNHSSRVDFRSCVSYRVFGSGFVTEAGDETGSFIGNLAMRSRGSGEDEAGRTDVQDFGHEGDGFWFQGPGVAVRENVACGQAAHGFIFFTQGLRQEGLGVARFAASAFADPSWDGRIGRVWHKDPARVNDAASAPVILVPITGFADNVAFNCDTGITVRFHAGSPAVAPSVIEKSTVWNARHGVKVRYTSHLVLRDLRLLGGGEKGAMTGVSGTLEGDQDIRYENLDVRGWACGIAVPEAGSHTIVGGTWANARSIVVPTPYGRGRRVSIVGDVRFADGPTFASRGAARVDIAMDAVYGPLLTRDVNALFAAAPVWVDVPGMKGQLYFAAQGADHVPFTSAPVSATGVSKRMGDARGVLPSELIGRNNAELAERFGLAIAGAVAPTDARRVAHVEGLLGGETKYGVERYATQLRTAELRGYQLVVAGGAAVEKRGQKFVELEPLGEAVELRPGWNLLTREVDGGRAASFLVYGGEGRGRGKGYAK